MLKQFDPDKTIQASGVLAKEHGNIISRLRLLKLLYMADRKSLQTIGHSITGDEVVAMKNGPVLSTTYDHIKNEPSAPFLEQWKCFFRNIGPQNVELVGEPGVDSLSQFEVETLQSLSREYADKDDWEVAEITHKFDEWEKNKPQGSMKVRVIPLDDVLAALGMMDRKERLLAEANAYQEFDRLLASCR